MKLRREKSRSKSLRVLAVMLMVVIAHAAAAQEAKVRASMATQDTIYVGQRTTMVVELLAPGYFSGTASFRMPDPSGLVMIPPMGSPMVGSETIGDASYTVQRHEVAVLAQRAGEFTIPPVPVRIQFKRAPLDKEIVTATVTTPEVKFTAIAPPGTEKLGRVISARNLEVTETWKPDPATAKPKAGDAFTRTITFKAPDIPGMMFPPFPAGEIGGIGIYKKDPEVNDKSDRGSLTGERHDVITYACQRAGQFTIPAARLTWWDLDAKQLKTVDFPQRVLIVVPNPALAAAASAEATQARAGSLKTWLVVGAVVLLAIAAACSAPAQRAIALFIAPLRPVHLQPLNPSPTHPNHED